MHIGITEIIIIALIVLLLFGGKKIPDLARSLGKAKGEFKKGLVEGEKAENAVEAEESKKIEKTA